MAEVEQVGDLQPRGFGRRATGPRRRVFVSAMLALTEPGPAAAGIAVVDDQDRLLASRSTYLGHARRQDATAQALLLAMRISIVSGLEHPTFLVDDAEIAEAASGSRWPPALERFREAIVQAGEHLGPHEVEAIPASDNQARAVALAPLVTWLPERTRRAEDLDVHPLGDGRYRVQSESDPDQSYTVTLRTSFETGDASDGRVVSDGSVGDGAQEAEPPAPRVMIECECADFVYRGLPCKHLLAVARQQGDLQQLFGPRTAFESETA